MDIKDIKLWKKRIHSREENDTEIQKLQLQRDEILSKIDLLTQKEDLYRVHRNIMNQLENQYAEFDKMKLELSNELEKFALQEKIEQQHLEKEDLESNIELDISIQLKKVQQKINSKTDRAYKNLANRFNSLLNSLFLSTENNVFQNIGSLNNYILKMEKEIKVFPRNAIPKVIHSELYKIKQLLHLDSGEIRYLDE